MKVFPHKLYCYNHILFIKSPSSQLHHSLEETPEAISLLGQLLISHPTLVDEEVINLLAELCILTKAYEQAYEVQVVGV